MDYSFYGVAYWRRSELRIGRQLKMSLHSVWIMPALNLITIVISVAVSIWV